MIFAPAVAVLVLAIFFGLMMVALLTPMLDLIGSMTGSNVHQ